MEYLYMISGFIVGWVGIEIAARLAGCFAPTLFNLACGFVGGFTAYELYTRLLS